VRPPIGCSPTPNSGAWPVAAEAPQRSRVLFLCTHNSARSQMAEGLLRHLAGDRFEAFSAGTEATRVRPLAVRTMEEIGIDISSQESKTLDRYLEESFDYVITVCDHANEACPFFPGAQSRRHLSCEDPSRVEGPEEERLAIFRSVRDRIRERIADDLVATDEVMPTS
jgi:arsenate reductase (thioredoxin)